MAGVRSFGSSSSLRNALFPLGFSGEVMLLVHKTWKTLALNPSVRHETRITAVFRDALIEAYRKDDRNWFTTLEDPITDPDFGTELGRNDLRFYPPNHSGQTIFFTVECKRLRIDSPRGIISNADKYVEEGVQRFVDGRYSAGLPCGGMIGYVVDGDISAAFTAVQTAIISNIQKLKINSDGIASPSAVTPKYKWSVDTRHKIATGDLLIHHTLLGLSKRLRTLSGGPPRRATERAKASK